MAKNKGNFRASKGSAPAIDIPGMQVAKQAKKKGGGFKKGGTVGAAASAPAPAAAVGKKAGGAAEGMKAGGRADHAPRMSTGGSLRGRSPMSGASSPSDPSGGGKAGGY